MKTKFQPSNGKTFKDLKVGDVFTTVAGGTALMRVLLRRSDGANVVSVFGDWSVFSDDCPVVHYPNAVLDMGQPS